MSYVCSKCGSIVSGNKHDYSDCIKWTDFLIQEEIKKNTNTLNSKKKCKDKDCDYYDVNYPKNCSTSPCSNKAGKGK